MPTLLETILTLLNVDLDNGFVRETLRQGPIDGVFFLIFFPTVFIILFIFILTNWILHGEGLNTKGMRILISVAIYAFIIMQGWFTLFINLSRLWFMIIILLFGFWIFTRHFTGAREGGGGRAGGMPGLGGEESFGGGLLKVVRSELKGDMKDAVKEITANYNLAKNAAEGLKNYKGDREGLWRISEEFRERLRMLEASIRKLEDLYKVGAPGLGLTNIRKKFTRRYWDRHNELVKLEGELINKQQIVPLEEKKKKKAA